MLQGSVRSGWMGEEQGAMDSRDAPSIAAVQDDVGAAQLLDVLDHELEAQRDGHVMCVLGDYLGRVAAADNGDVFALGQDELQAAALDGEVDVLASRDADPARSALHFDLHGNCEAELNIAMAVTDGHF